MLFGDGESRTHNSLFARQARFYRTCVPTKVAPPPGLPPGSPALEVRRSLSIELRGRLKVDSRVGLAPTNDRFAAGRFGFFSLREEWRGVLVTLQARGTLVCFTGKPASLTVYRREMVAGLGVAPSKSGL